MVKKTSKKVTEKSSQAENQLLKDNSPKLSSQTQRSPLLTVFTKKGVKFSPGEIIGYANGHGEVQMPQGWVFVSTGQALLTRHIKKQTDWWEILIKVNLSSYQKVYKTIGFIVPESVKASIDNELAQSSEKRALLRVKRGEKEARIITKKWYYFGSSNSYDFKRPLEINSTS